MDGTTHLIKSLIKTDEDFSKAELVIHGQHTGNLKKKFDAVLATLPLYAGNNPKCKLRKNGVLAVVLEFSAYSIQGSDIQQWEKDCSAWATMKYIMNDNAILESKLCRSLDSNSVSYYFVFIPITSEGKISHASFFRSIYSIQNDQKEYLKLVNTKYGFTYEPIGYVKPGSVFYNGNRLEMLPEPLKDENVNDYRDRVSEAYQNLQSSNKSLKKQIQHLNEESANVISKDILYDYIELVNQYGSMEQMRSLLSLATDLKYGMVHLRKTGNTDGINYVNEVLKAGKQYREKAKA